MDHRINGKRKTLNGVFPNVSLGQARDKDDENTQFKSIESISDPPIKIKWEQNFMKKMFLPLESLRGFAAISVALFHLSTNSHLELNFVKNAWLMVDFFFVLSGFVISLNYSHDLSPKN